MRRAPDLSVLYLRNFGDDTQRILTSRFNRRGVWQRSTGWLNPIGSARFEEVLTRALAHSGPVVAVGRPGNRLRRLYSAMAPTLGAARTTLGNDWLDHVTHWAENAHAVVVSATPLEMKQGLADEMKTLAEKVEHGRIILVFGTGTKAALHQRFGAFLNAVRHYPLFHDLASGWLSDGALVVVHVPAEGWGTWYGWGAERRTAWTYAAAIGAAMAYAEEAWARPPAKLVPPCQPALQHEPDWGLTSQPLAGPPPGTPSRAAGPPPARPTWTGPPLTGACTRALETACQLSRQYREDALQVGFLVLGLIASGSNAAARALNIGNQEQQRELSRLVQEDLIGTRLTDLPPPCYRAPHGNPA